ncbi:universal stress protein [Winogradskyella sp.]|jgi:nucleotide-binding universal stress UspA family protein|uniref:universal stress protein n=1 Tax=Winogradskyella sp. TaxID=1883156 RepID=UPI0025D2A01C|nr:universal stress protein [Winogradskyella sp.]MCT4628899.1 universal stress protein [Winogradskyella sp.]
MKKILLPTDFSDNAWCATVYALKLYANEECIFYFLHSYKMKTSAMSNISNKLLRSMAENAKQELIEIKEMAEKANANPKHKFEAVLSIDAMEDAIEIATKKHNIDLIIMGTKGATGAKEIFMGSNTVEIIKHIKTCPILLIPHDCDFKEPEQIAFPTDFNRFYGEELVPLKELSKLYNSKIRVLHINKEENLSHHQNYNLAMLEAYLEDYPHAFHWMPDYSKKEHTIMDFIDDLNIDILVMINYQHSFIENIINEPVIEKIGFHAKIPFFVIPSSA